MIYHFDTLQSTNDEARDLHYSEGDIIVARRQTSGRGQRGHSWESREGENLTFSLVLTPTFLPTVEQFKLLQTIALSLVDMFAAYDVKTLVKWTNDIYVGNNKIVGILIEHQAISTTLQRTIVGIGINVNQQTFSEALPNPTSMALELGRTLDLEEVLLRFQSAFAKRYDQLKSGNSADIHAAYNALLYRHNTPATYRLPDGTTFEGRICEVQPRGELVVEHSDGVRKSYLFKEIEFVIGGASSDKSDKK